MGLAVQAQFAERGGDDGGARPAESAYDHHPMGAATDVPQSDQGRSPALPRAAVFRRDEDTVRIEETNRCVEIPYDMMQTWLVSLTRWKAKDLEWCKHTGASICACAGIFGFKLSLRDLVEMMAERGLSLRRLRACRHQCSVQKSRYRPAQRPASLPAIAIRTEVNSPNLDVEPYTRTVNDRRGKSVRPPIIRRGIWRAVDHRVARGNTHRSSYDNGLECPSQRPSAFAAPTKAPKRTSRRARALPRALLAGDVPN